jgi:hypothetical protein
MAAGTAAVTPTAAATAGSQQCENTDSRCPDNQHFFKGYTSDS